MSTQQALHCHQHLCMCRGHYRQGIYTEAKMQGTKNNTCDFEQLARSKRTRIVEAIFPLL